MRRPWKKIALTALISAAAHGVDNNTDKTLNEILVVTENTSISVESMDQPGTGEAARFVEALLERAGFDYQTRMVPWRRGYQMAKTRPNTLIFPLARTQNREEDFYWIGQLIPVHYHLFRLENRNDLTLISLEQAKDFRIGVVNYHAHHEFLLRSGMTKLQPVNSSAQNIKKLLLGRIDFFPMSDIGIFPLCRRNQVDCQQLVPEIELKNAASGLFIAFSKQTDYKKVVDLREAYQTLVDDGTLNKHFARRRAFLEKFNSTYSVSNTKAP